MPRRPGSRISSALRQMQRQADALVAKLHREIRTKEAELKRLKQDAMQLAGLTGRTRAARATQGGGGGGGGGRINWRAVLSRLPKRFKAADIRRVRGLANKRPSEIFAAITRWIDAGMAKRKTRGLYERTK